VREFLSKEVVRAGVVEVVRADVVEVVGAVFKSRGRPWFEAAVQG
jgi:hypothetical protein